MKKTITVVIIILVALGLAYYLFKISPQQSQQTASSAYNGALDTATPPKISTPPTFDPSLDHYLGDPKAKNVFIEYGDFQCPACAAYSDLLKQVPNQFENTVFVFRYFPLIQIHQNSVEAALAAEAAGVQGKYWEMHDILFQKQPDWETISDPLDTFALYAQSVGVANIGQFKSDITSKKYLAAINKNFNEANGLNLPGTPSFFFNGHTIANKDLNGLKQEAAAFLNK
jgi:protein-disulfide isomerase